MALMKINLTEGYGDRDLGHIMEIKLKNMKNAQRMRNCLSVDFQPCWDKSKTIKIHVNTFMDSYMQAGFKKNK